MLHEIRTQPNLIIVSKIYKRSNCQKYQHKDDFSVVFCNILDVK